MAPMMFGPLVLLAASASPIAPALPPAGQGVVNYRATSTATAHATVSIRIVSGVRFGDGQISGAENATRRTAEIREPEGLVMPAELLEFQ